MSLFKLFKCVGCRQNCELTLCENCSKSIRYNSLFLPSPISQLEAIIPLLYSLGTTHEIFKKWKSNPGFWLKNTLLKIAPSLLTLLQEQKFDCIVPVPQSWNRSWQRGHASADVVANYFSSLLNVPILHLLKIRDDLATTKKQSELEAVDRDFGQNPFVVISDMTHSRSNKILLIDDLITTGNTLARASEALKMQYAQSRFFGGSLAYRPNFKLT